MRYSNISNTTEARRNQFKGAIDEFCTFKWNDLDSWDTFGAFIIADKRGDLKTSSGPTFTNNYSKPQFETAAGQLQGITFNTKQISFKVGIYWASMEDYRKFLNWLNPYEVADLQFGYDNDYAYFCKLAKIDDASKYVVGQEKRTRIVRGVSEEYYESMYYFETNISFELQGEACAHKKYSYGLIKTASKNEDDKQEFDLNHMISGNALEPFNKGLISISDASYKDNLSIFDHKIRARTQSELDTYFKIELFNFGADVRQAKAKVNFPKIWNPKTGFTLLNEEKIIENIKFTITPSDGCVYNYITTRTNGIWVGMEVSNFEKQVYTYNDSIESWSWSIDQINVLEDGYGEFCKIDEEDIFNNYFQTENTDIGIGTDYWTRSWDPEISGEVDTLSLELGIIDDEEETFNLIQTLFTITFKDDIDFESISNWHFVYDSQQGVVYWGTEDQLTPLTYLTFWDGRKVVSSLKVSQCVLPGSNTAPLNYSKLAFRVKLKFKEDLEIKGSGESEDKINSTLSENLENEGINKLSGSDINAISGNSLYLGSDMVLTMYDRRQII